MTSFFFASTPHIHFGSGARSKLPEIIRSYGKKVLLVTGAKSFDASEICQETFSALQQEFDIHRIQISGEPSPEIVDGAVAEYKNFSPDCVVALGGGSVVDAAKAIAGLLPTGDSVMLYLEGVGHGKIYLGPSAPFIALPTTAGTGGETSKNAVLSEVGDDGFKKSFRHEKLVAKHIILDAELTLSCPKAVTAACGMDAFTQLLESYVSTNANLMTDALAISGMESVRDSLITAVDDGESLRAREGMLYASSMSGLTLANAGLGSVHGLASPLGAFFPMPHGQVCGTLLHEATDLNIRAMREREPDNLALLKYAAIGRLFSQNSELSDDDAQLVLLHLLKQWTEHLAMPPLSLYGVKRTDFDRIIDNISGGSMATNPIVLTRQEITDLLSARL